MRVVPVETTGVGSPGTGVPGGRQLLGVGAGN